MRCLFLLVPAVLAASDAEALKPETLRAFHGYVHRREAGIENERARGGRFLWLDDAAERRDRARAGQVVIEPSAGAGKGAIEVKGGLIHDWIGAAFMPGAKLKDVVSMVQDYDNHKNIYRPEIVDSKLRGQNGNRYKVHLRLLKKKVITVVLNTEHDVEYFPLDARRVHSRSRSTRIAEVDDAGTAKEKERRFEEGHGFLWRINSYWRFEERDGGVYIECEAISLTRGVPFGLGMIVLPVIRDLPRESLVRTMEATRGGLSR